MTKTSEILIKTWRLHKNSFYIAFGILEEDKTKEVFVLQGKDDGPGEARHFSHSRLWFYEDEDPDVQESTMEEAREIWCEATRKGYTRYR